MEIAKEVQALIKRQAEGSDRASKEIIIKNQDDFDVFLNTHTGSSLYS